MNRSLIVARMAPEAEADVAEIFARSDATGLPRQLGVMKRSLFSFHGLYFHLIDFDRDAEQALYMGQRLPGFRAISDDLRSHISAYDPAAWNSPRDAMARCFYHWSAPDGTAARPVAPSPLENSEAP